MKNEVFEKDIEIIPEIFPTLKIVDSKDELILKGSLVLEDKSGHTWDTYQVEIIGSDKYPYAFPRMFETGDAFPKNIDWHVYDDGSCCVDIPHNEIILCKEGMSVDLYLKQFAIPYFANQTYRIREGYYLYGEYSHGIFGKIEFYQSKLKAKNPQQLLQMMELVVLGYSPVRTEYCPFCQSSKFRNCHRDVFRELSIIKDYITFDQNQMGRFFMTNPWFVFTSSLTTH